MEAVIFKKMNVSYEIAEYAEEFYASDYFNIKVLQAAFWKKQNR